MTVLNFPDTTGKPTDGSFKYPADGSSINGVIYTWNGTYWAANNATGLSDTFVQIAGDTMTGDLKLPSLEATGTGTFGGNVDIGGSSIQLNADGSGEFAGGLDLNDTLNVYRASTFEDHSIANWRSDVGGTKVPKVKFLADGSAIFAGGVTFGPENAGTFFNSSTSLSLGNSAIIENTDVNGYGIKFIGGGASNVNYVADFRTYDGTRVLTLDGNGDANFIGKVTADTFKYSGSAPSPALAGKEINLVKTIELMAAKLAELGDVDVASLFVAEDPVTQPADPADGVGASGGY